MVVLQGRDVVTVLLFSKARYGRPGRRGERILPWSVERLGADTIAVRIGAVYSFARLMRDSPGDRRAITEILSGFVRVQAAEALHPQDRRPASPPADVLAALKVL